MSSLPYVTAPGNIDKALAGIKAASVPDRVSQDFVKEVLKIPGGSGNQITTFLKKLGLANSDGTPSQAYSKFKNLTSSKSTIANAIKKAYAPLYIRNEYMHQLSDEELKGLVIEETGQADGSNAVKCIVSCIKHLKEFANFEEIPDNTELSNDLPSSEVRRRESESFPTQNPKSSIGLNLGYTINLNLPATSDPKVFDAIFKSLKDNLLREDDG